MNAIARIGLVLLLTASSALAAPPVRTIEVDSASVGRKLKVNVALPADYDKSGDRRYPVVYLLHGYSGNYGHWERYEASRSSEPFDLILVMPDGGNSWWTNWSGDENGEKNAWDDFVVKDLIPYIDRTYRTIARREGRAINGLSMGGFGAMAVGLRHPDLFCSVGSESGALEFAAQQAKSLREGRDIRTPRETIATKADPRVTTEGFSSQAERTPQGRIFTKPEDAENNDPFVLVLRVPKDKLPHIYLDCGTDDPFLDASRRFVKLLIDHKIRFTYAESPGDHNRAYWTREIGHALAAQSAIIRRELSKP